MKEVNLTKLGEVVGLDVNAVSEMAMVISTPANPEKPFIPIVEDICETLVVSPTEPVEYFEVEDQNEYVYEVTAVGVLTEKEKTVATTQTPTFIDLVSDLQTVTVRELNSCREGGASFFGKRMSSMDRGLNMRETGMLLNLVHVGATAQGNVFGLSDSDVSGLTRLDMTHITKVIESIEDFGSNITMYCGADIYRQLRDMAYIKNLNSGILMDPFTYLREAYDIQRVIPIKKKDLSLKYTYRNMNTSGSSETLTEVMPATRAYFVATETTVGKPIGFIRKSQELFTGFGGFDATGQLMAGDETVYAQRPLLVTQPPMYDNNFTANVLKKGLVKYETIAVFSKNTYAFAEWNLA